MPTDQTNWKIAISVRRARRLRTRPVRQQSVLRRLIGSLGLISCRKMAEDDIIQIVSHPNDDTAGDAAAALDKVSVTAV